MRKGDSVYVWLDKHKSVKGVIQDIVTQARKRHLGHEVDYQTVPMAYVVEITYQDMTGTPHTTTIRVSGSRIRRF